MKAKLTKREYFAGLAMQGILANKQTDVSFTDILAVTDIACNAIGMAEELIELLDVPDDGPAKVK